MNFFSWGPTAHLDDVLWAFHDVTNCGKVKARILGDSSGRVTSTLLGIQSMVGQSEITE